MRKINRQKINNKIINKNISMLCVDYRVVNQILQRLKISLNPILILLELLIKKKAFK